MPKLIALLFDKTARDAGRCRRWSILQPSVMIAFIAMWLFCAITPIQAQMHTKPLLMSQQQRMLQKMGEAVIVNFRRQHHLLADPIIEDYLFQLQKKLVDENDLLPIIPAVVIKDDSFNAFALPGGYMGIHSGLFALMHSEDELAAVMAHELAHINQRHIERLMARGKTLDWATLAGLVGAAVVSSQNPDAGIAMANATVAGVQQMAINYTRVHEAEADHIGIRYMAKAGFDASAMADTFKHMLQASRYLDNPMPFLQTHPMHTSRIAEAAKRAEYYRKPAVPTSRLAFALIKTRVAILMSQNGSKTLQHAQKRFQQKPHDQVAQYAVALAEQLFGSAAKAEKMLTTLVQQYPQNRLYALALAQQYLQLGKANKAVKVLAQSHSDHYDVPMQLLYAQALIELHRTDQAITRLSQAISRYPTAPLYHLLAKAQNQAGYKAQSHQALAEYYALQGEYTLALSQLNIAKKLTQDKFIQAAILDRQAQLKDS